MTACARIRFSLLVVALVTLCGSALFANPAVRMLRLSFAEGDVQIDRNAGAGWEQALNNMPVIAGTRIYAAESSKAELEFEDGSRLRLSGPAQMSVVELSTGADGRPAERFQLSSGILYVDAKLLNHDDFRIEGPTGESFAITQPSQLRFKVTEMVASLSVTAGEVKIQGPAVGSSEVRAGQSYNFILGQPESAARMDQVPPQPDDGWNQQRESAEQQSAEAAAQNEPGADAATAELSQYGAYENIPGYGQMWQPYGVGPDWSPYDYGAWSDYPWGWTYVSGYPWGWTPYYYGSWCYVHGRGWWWRRPNRTPRGWGSDGWHAQPRYTGNPPRHFNSPTIPSRTSHGTTLAVAGSKLRVGPVAHAPSELSAAAVSRSGSGIPAGGPAGKVGVNSNLVRGHVVTTPPSSMTSGQKGGYSSHNGYAVHRPPIGGASASRGYSSAGPARAYAAPPAAISRPYVPVMPRVSAPPAASHGSAAPTVHSGGYSGGSSFHGGAVGGASHGGGGGGHR
jgi:uncharacterized membrane protein YgcG